jgi:hypothetical protein
MFKAKCEKCGAELRLGPVLSVVYPMVLIAVGIIAFIVVREGNFKDILVFVGIVFLTGFLADILFWRYGNYKLKDE